MGNKVVVKAGTSKELSPEDITMLKQISQLSEEEIKEVHKEFWNEYPTGKMDKKGYAKYYQEIMGEEDKTGALCDNMFALSDNNHDGTIDFQELLLSLAVSSPKDLPSHLDYIFRICDISGDGQMDVKELADFFSSGFTLVGKNYQASNANPKKMAIEVFKMFGMREDQKLTKEQFIEGCQSEPILREVFGTSD